MSNRKHKHQTGADHRMQYTPPAYPAWVKELINQRIDEGIARYKRSSTTYQPRPVPPTGDPPR
jgi:hypothetical protein